MYREDVVYVVSKAGPSQGINAELTDKASMAKSVCTLTICPWWADLPRCMDGFLARRAASGGEAAANLTCSSRPALACCL